MYENSFPSTDVSTNWVRCSYAITRGLMGIHADPIVPPREYATYGLMVPHVMTSGSSNDSLRMESGLGESVKRRRKPVGESIRV